MDTNLIYTILYCCAFVLLLWNTINKHEGLMSSYVIGVWVVSSFFAILFQIVFGTYDNLSVIPYVFMIACIIISMKPVRNNYEHAKSNIPIIESPFLDYLMWGFILVSIIPFFENLRYVISTYGANDTSGLADMYEDKMYGAGLRITWLSSIGMFGNSIDGVFVQFLEFIAFFYLTRVNTKKILVILSFLPVVNHILFQLASSGRGFATQFLLNAVFFFLFFRDRMPVKRIRLVRITGLAAIGAFVLAMSVLTIARRDSTNRGVETTVALGYYVAKSHLDFNQDLWHIRKHTEGDNSFGLVKKALGFDVPLDKNEYWNYNKTGITPSLFYTYVGDWYMDFGAIITLLLFIIFSFIADRYFARSKLQPNIVSLFFMFVYYEIILNGWTINIFKTQGSLQNLIFSIILLVIVNKTIKYSYEQQES